MPMQVMVIIKANQESEAGALPDEKFFLEMEKYNQELIKAGVMLAAHGLHPTSNARRVKFSDGKVTVPDGPFAETMEVIAGFWIWKVNSFDEAVGWVKRCPSPEGETEGEMEIRQVFEEDCGVETPPEQVKEKIERMRSELGEQQVS